MKLVIGGAHQGKTAFAHTLSEHVCLNLHDLIRACMQEGGDPWALAAQLASDYTQGVITVAEVGCGLVPMDAFEREYRETVGRISCELAAQASEVYRVSCGIAVRIK